jgi:uncharacterized protein (UPF0332 family)
MTEPQKNIVGHRLARAREALIEAKVLMEAHHHVGAVNRFYYACFYAVTALLETQSLASSKHSGVRSLFNLHFVKRGLVSTTLSKFYGDLFDARHVGDYSDFPSFTQEEIEQLQRQSIEFVEVVSRLAETHIADS